MNSISKEDYLSTIYKYRDDEGEIRPNIIAEHMQISNPAVTDMLKKLSKDKLVIYKPYKAVKFTHHGEVEAKRLIRRHRIWEIFLHEVVGLSWDKVHEEAERLEHHSSDELINRLDEMLNFPEFDPHGDPIPSREGKMPVQPEQIALSEVQPAALVTVQRVSSFDGKFLTYIRSLGIQIGTALRIIEIRNFDRSLMLEVNGQPQSISSVVADNIFVTPL
jgi:DtxR family Mn-dependent transcriptional regulator